MSALHQLRASGVEVRLNGDGDPVAKGLDRLPPEVAGPLLELARACREGIRAELLSGLCPYSETELARFRVSHPHLICCPTTTPPWWWKYKTACSRCKTPCGRQENIIEVIQ
jgi:hypothetical protein